MDDDKVKENKIEKILDICGFILFIVVVISGVWWGYDNFIPIAKYTNITIMDTEISSLSDGSTIHGSFFIGSGHVSSESVYVYYTSVGNKSYKRETTPTDYTIIVMDENKKPYLRTIQLTSTRCTKVRCSTSNGGLKPYDPKWRWGIYRYELHVPENTLVQDYKVGA